MDFMKVLNYTVIFEPQEEGGFTAIVPALPGCISEGDTLEEARESVADAIKAYIESLEKHGEDVPADVGKPIQERIRVTMA
jgi:predicted RNase H-like HicB family nuclease